MPTGNYCLEREQEKVWLPCVANWVPPCLCASNANEHFFFLKMPGQYKPLSFFRFHISVISYDSGLSLSDRLHLGWESLGPFVLLQMSLCHYFFWLSSIPFCTTSSSIHQWTFRLISMSWPSWIVLQQTQGWHIFLNLIWSKTWPLVFASWWWLVTMTQVITVGW